MEKMNIFFPLPRIDLGHLSIQIAFSTELCSHENENRSHQKKYLITGILDEGLFTNAAFDNRFERVKNGQIYISSYNQDQILSKLNFNFILIMQKCIERSNFAFNFLKILAVFALQLAL